MRSKAEVAEAILRWADPVPWILAKRQREKWQAALNESGELHRAALTAQDEARRVWPPESLIQGVERIQNAAEDASHRFDERDNAILSEQRELIEIREWLKDVAPDDAAVAAALTELPPEDCCALLLRRPEHVTDQWLADRMAAAHRALTNEPPAQTKPAPAGERDSATAEGAPHPLEDRPQKVPSDAAFAAWRLQHLAGLHTQEAIAKTLTHELRRPISQGQVSRWLNWVKDWLSDGNPLPPVAPAGRAETVDPNLLDMGPRQDGRTRRQRPRRDDD